jgi:hypothetical protein
MKQLVVLAIAVLLGIWVYKRLTAQKAKVGVNTGTQPAMTDFAGPDIDPKTGAYLPAGAKPGTVEFSAQGN